MTGTAPHIRLPAAFMAWFKGRGWQPHRHQLEMLAAAEAAASCLLVAPTGGGKTLAGFLPSLVDLATTPRTGLHTLYISPLKSLAVDVHRNLEQPIAEMALPISVETRSGDTPASKKKQQREKPPNILLTTPESLALLISYPDAATFFSGLTTIVIDELHALVDNKRGELMSLALARLRRLAPAARRVGLSATVAYPDALRAYLASGPDDTTNVRLVQGDDAVQPKITIALGQERVPWSGHMAAHAVAEIYKWITARKTTIVFVNTRAQSEIIFQELWRLNTDNLPIALHHGSLAREQRRKVEAAMAQGDLRAVVATSSLDLGIDWGAVDLVVQVGAPKGAARLLQRVGRANHRLDSPSEAVLVPANRFEVLECQAAVDAVQDMTLDGGLPNQGGLDVLAQHVMGTACAGPFHPDQLFDEVRRAAPFSALSREDFDAVVEFVATGGYALSSYERFRRLVAADDGYLSVASPRAAHAYRMNVGTIVEAQTLKVRVGKRSLGQVEEYFAQGLRPGDTFIFAGQLLTFIEIRDMSVIARRGGVGEPAVPVFAGGRLPLSTHLADRVRAMLADDQHWPSLPAPVEEWLRFQQWRSVLPGHEGLLVEQFPRADREYLVAYCFAGRNAHQTLGMLLTKRMERAGYDPLGFVATDYVIAIWSLRPVRDIEALFDQDMLGDDLEAWMADSSLLRRTFRHVSVVAGLIQMNLPGHEKSRRQVTFNSDLIYDTLRRHQPNHVLLKATRHDASRGLTDIDRLAQFLIQIQGRITTRRLDRVSPLAVPILLEVGRERVEGGATDTILDELEADLITEATGGEMQSALPI